MPGGNIIDPEILLHKEELCLAVLEDLRDEVGTLLLHEPKDGQGNTPARGLARLVLDLADVAKVARVGPGNERVRVRYKGRSLG